MSKKTLALIITLLVLTIVLVVIALSTKQASLPAQTNTSSAPTATPTPFSKGHTSLFFSPNPILLAGSTSANTVDIMINTGGDDVRSVQLEIAYDPAVLQNVTIKPGTFFNNPQILPIGGINQNTGRITYAITPASFKESQKGTGLVATLSFFPILTPARPTTTISLLEKSLVSGQARGQNVLIKTDKVTISIPTR